jgi:hypothetical protein
LPAADGSRGRTSITKRASRRNHVKVARQGLASQIANGRTTTLLCLAFPLGHVSSHPRGDELTTVPDNSGHATTGSAVAALSPTGLPSCGFRFAWQSPRSRSMMAGMSTIVLSPLG